MNSKNCLMLGMSLMILSYQNMDTNIFLTYIYSVLAMILFLLKTAKTINYNTFLFSFVLYMINLSLVKVNDNISMSSYLVIAIISINSAMWINYFDKLKYRVLKNLNPLSNIFIVSGIIIYLMTSLLINVLNYELMYYLLISVAVIIKFKIYLRGSYKESNEKNIKVNFQKQRL